MLPTEILKKVKLIEIKTRHLINNIFGGDYHSAFKGMGMEFAEVREYSPGDDVRNIDWNVTARTGKPFVKKFEEERELTVMILVDVSASGYFGIGKSLKSDLMVEIASILSFSAIKNNDKVGLLLFSDQIEKFIPPQKGRKHVFRILRELIYFKAEDRKTNISLAVEHLLHTLKRKSVVFLLSDFIDSDFQTSLKIANKKHDLICIHAIDESEIEFPDLGLIKIHDPESQDSHWVDSTTILKHNMKSITQKRNDDHSKFCKRHDIDLISIKTHEGVVNPLIQFFQNRISRK
jgi:uncharacterized protein (DUF58 family)